MKQLGIINNFDKEIDKFKQRFNISLKSCRNQITWQFIHYSQLEDPKTIESLENMDGLLLTGSYHMLSDEKTRESYRIEMNIIKNFKKPILGICFGLQLIASAFGFEIRPIKHPDINVENEKSIILKIDPKFDLFPEDRIHAYESHLEEVYFKPEFLEIFKIYASSPSCEIQIIKHKSKPIYGIQFHPEYPDDPLTFRDGTILLKNYILNL